MLRTKPKILFCLPAFSFGGTVFSTLNMISFLKEEYDVFVLPMTYQGPILEQYINAGITLLPESRKLSAMMGKIKNEKGVLNKMSSLYHKTLRKILKYINFNYSGFLLRKEARRIEKQYKFDFVASCQEGGATYFISNFSSPKKIAWFRSEYKFYLERISSQQYIKEQSIYKKIDEIVCVSKTTAEDFKNYISASADKVTAIHNFQNVQRIIEKSRSSIDDRRFITDEFVIVSIGRIDPQKRFSYIPEIAAKIKERNLRFKWYIIGEGNVMGEKDRIYQNIKKYNVEDIVIPLGSKTNPYPYIHAAKLLVNTSYVEACPRVVIEAKILGKPVICADFSSAREFVKDGYDGYVDTIDCLDNHIADMINNLDLRSSIEENSKKYKIDNDQIRKQLRKVFSI